MRRKSCQATLGCSLGKLKTRHMSPNVLCVKGKMKRSGMSPAQRLVERAKLKRIVL